MYYPIAAVAAGGAATLMTDVYPRFGKLPGGPWPEAPQSALILPIPGTNEHQRAGVLVIGISPRLPFDDDYRGFCDLVARHLGAAVANARAAEADRHRAAALAELDQAKTTFFSNVSHEFRTPLTLMLGPIEDSLADTEQPLAPHQRERQMLIHRNGLRLLKLVNALLDVARLEAGRTLATYVPVDIGALTAQLASVFRSAIERTGILFVVDCQTPPDLVYIDCDMWEKIVFNLLSNALKYTFTGQIVILLRSRPGAVELQVRDTGIGIPAADLPRLFERFHRVANARGRTHEGTGIGLSLVHDLAHLHGGTVGVESSLGHGTTFRVTIPTGSAHLPPEQIGQPLAQAHPGLGAAPFLEEVQRWAAASVPNERPSLAHQQPFLNLSTPAAHILIADDNADMRDYLTGLLAPLYCITAVSTGQLALAVTQRSVPDLVLTDIMMPDLDGIGLLHALRADERSAHVPVIMLSARAGEEAIIDGLHAGADDYLVKPFSAGELRARISSALELTRLRHAAADRDQAEREHLRQLFAQMPAIICVVQEPGHIFEMVNAACQKLFPGRTLVGRPLAEAVPEIAEQHILEILDEVARSGVAHTATNTRFIVNTTDANPPEAHYYDYVVQPFQDLNSSTQKLILFAIDVTERVHTQDVLLNTQKLESLGVLAGGIAHDFNNLLTTILGNASLALFDLDGHPAQHSVDQIQIASKRAADLTHQLLAYAGRSSFQITEIDLNTLIHEMTSLLLVTMPKNATLYHDLAPCSPIISGDATQMRQILMNLIINGAEALDSARGAVFVTTRRKWLDAAYLARCHGAPDLQPGQYILLTVTDTGRGMSAETQARIFDPFFTTKFTGRGLGMAAVQGIVRGHHGAIRIESAPGRGTKMTVLLPLAPNAPPQRSDDPQRHSASDPASGTILIIDDEPDVRQVTAQILRHYGYQVRMAENGWQGLALALQHTTTTKCVLLDLTMPEMSGEETLRQLRIAAPTLPIILMSGYGEQDARRTIAANAPVAFIHKPFTPSELAQTIRQVLRNVPI
jgi:signal transduction histidine kinase/DNA-binding response OmpR family regulator